VVEVQDFEFLMSEWMELAVVMNALNRSMGQPDAYPFSISSRVKDKLQFVHALVQRAQGNT
jgi:hypothetical protein